MEKIKNVESLLNGRFIRIHRLVLDNLFYGTPLEKRVAHLYLYMLCSCYYKRGITKVGFRFYECGPGEFVKVKRDICEAVSMTRHAYEMALDELVSRGLVRVESGKNHTRIILPYYEAITGQTGGKYTEPEAEPERNATPQRGGKKQPDQELIPSSYIDMVPYPADDLQTPYEPEFSEL